MILKSDRAEELFRQGFNCSQSVFTAFAEDYDLEEKMALKISSSFGGGMGRMREVCGALSGAFMVIGLESGSTVGNDSQAKKHNYDIVQKVAKKFKEENGSIYCRELLGLSKEIKDFSDTMPEERKKEYYEKRPCVEIVRNMCNIIEEIVLERHE